MGVAGDFILDTATPHTQLAETRAQSAGYAETALSGDGAAGGDHPRPGGPAGGGRRARPAHRRPAHPHSRGDRNRRAEGLRAGRQLRALPDRPSIRRRAGLRPAATCRSPGSPAGRPCGPRSPTAPRTAGSLHRPGPGPTARSASATPWPAPRAPRSARSSIPTACCGRGWRASPWRATSRETCPAGLMPAPRTRRSPASIGAPAACRATGCASISRRPQGSLLLGRRLFTLSHEMGRRGAYTARPWLSEGREEAGASPGSRGSLTAP